MGRIFEGSKRAIIPLSAGVLAVTIVNAAYRADNTTSDERAYSNEDLAVATCTATPDQLQLLLSGDVGQVSCDPGMSLGQYEVDEPLIVDGIDILCDAVTIASDTPPTSGNTYTELGVLCDPANIVGA